MTDKLNLVDRLRIERVVWGLDQRIYDLPHRKRIAIRREVRDNLRTAARDVGAKAGVRYIGTVHSLAAGYLDAQFGGRPRPSWIAATVFALTSVLILQALLTEAALGFRALAWLLIVAGAIATGRLRRALPMPTRPQRAVPTPR